MNGTAWTSDRIEMLRSMWNAGKTAGQIGLALGVTKNVIIGKAHRLDLPRRESCIKPKLNAALAQSRDARIKGLSEIAGVDSEPTRENHLVHTSERATIRGIVKMPTKPTPPKQHEPTPAAIVTAPKYVPALTAIVTTPKHEPAPAAIVTTPKHVPVPAAIVPPTRKTPTPEGCRWPMWGFREEPTHRYCETPRLSATHAYCGAHHAVAFTPARRFHAA